jgi:NAD(P)-dependent dehydrogenase (short-subunit alcohol dehydrogenase family)
MVIKMSVHSELRDRHVVVTGGTGALGRSVVESFLRAGAICHVPVRRPIPAAAPENATGESQVRYVAGIDLTNESSVVSFFAGLPDNLWASVHVAGGFAMGAIADTSLADLRSQIDMNLVTSFLCCREAVRRFRLREGGGGGRIVNVASRTALQPGGQKAAYNLAKAAVVSLTSSLAVELAPEGILVNAVAPGTIDTGANRAAMPDADRAAMVDPKDIADVIVWLASPENRVGSGAVVPVYGKS